MTRPLELYLLAIGSALGVDPIVCASDPAKCWDAYALTVLEGAATAIRQFDQLLAQYVEALQQIEGDADAADRAVAPPPQVIEHALERAVAVLDSLLCECTESWTCTVHADRRLMTDALDALRAVAEPGEQDR